MYNKRAIVLLSGGLDSAVMFYQAKKQGYECLCLIFDYGQRHKREIESAKKIAQSVRCAYQVLKIELPWEGSSLLNKKSSVPIRYNVKTLKRYNVIIPSTYVPGRNIIFLSLALSYAEAADAEAIFIGVHSQDYSGYPDCRQEFYRAFINAARQGTKRGIEGNPIKIMTPLIHKNKSQIIRLGARLNVPFELTWSCYSGKRNPCTRCDSCYFRDKGFKEAGLTDPLLIKR